MTQHLDAAATESVKRLQDAWSAYTSALQEVAGLGESSVSALTAALNHKHASAVAAALGHMMHTAAAEKAIPALLDWAVVQSPMYRDVVAALRKAGDQLTPHLVDRIEKSSTAGDDEAVRNLLDVAQGLSSAGKKQLVPIMLKLLEHDDPHIREAAVDAFASFGLPEGQCAVFPLETLAQHDPEEAVRTSAMDALIRLGAETNRAYAVPASAAS